MTISYPLTFPTTTFPVTQTWSIKRQVGVSESPFTGTQQTVEFDYAKWQVTVSMPPVRGTTATELTSFLTKLHGRRGTFLMGDADRRTPQNSISGDVQVDGNFSVGDAVISITGTTAFSQGDMIQIGGGSAARLYMVIGNQSGSSSIQIEPKLKNAVSNDQEIVYTNPKGIFRMDANTQSWDTNAVSNYGISFSCTEVD